MGGCGDHALHVGQSFGTGPVEGGMHHLFQLVDCIDVAIVEHFCSGNREIACPTTQIDYRQVRAGQEFRQNGCRIHIALPLGLHLLEAFRVKFFLMLCWFMMVSMPLMISHSIHSSELIFLHLGLGVISLFRIGRFIGGIGTIAAHIAKPLSGTNTQKLAWLLQSQEDVSTSSIILVFSRCRSIASSAASITCWITQRESSLPQHSNSEALPSTA